MTSNEAVSAVIAALEDARIPYMVTGSYASNAYGLARATKDADIVIEVVPDALRGLVERLGPELQLDRQMTFETITSTTRNVIAVAASPFKIELFHLSADAFDRERFARRVLSPFLGRMSYLQTAEDVVVQKLRWSKEGRRRKDVEDARSVIAVSGSRLDWPYIHGWCERHGTRALLDEIRNSIPPL